MADEIGRGESQVRVIRLVGRRDNAGAWEIPCTSNRASGAARLSWKV
jgi:hypothetical protein